MLTTIQRLWGNAAPPLAWGFVAVLAALVVGTAAAVLLSWRRPGPAATELGARMASWWLMAVGVAGALVLGWQATTLAFAVISFLALREFLSLAPARREDRLVILACYLTIPVSYAIVAAGIYMFYLVFIPVWVFLATPFLMAAIGQTRGYLTSAAVFQWGVVTCVYNLGLIPLLMRTPGWDAPQAGAVGLVFLLLVATELNDVFQFVCGKLFGRHKILPSVSPNKTWEGFVGGWALTALLIWFAGPLYTPLHGVGLAVVAAVLPVAGFAGDVTFSAIKRDIGVKDTSRLIPGHGGVLDRLDSLTFTTPVYFHLLALFCLKTY